MEIILLGDEIKVMESSLEAKLALISALEARQKGLQENVQQLESETAAARAEKDRMAQEFEEKMAAISEETRLQIEEVNRKFAALTQQLGEQQELVVVLNTKKRDLELALAKQRKAFVVLEDKYNKLIGPARSSLGKMVAAGDFQEDLFWRAILLKLFCINPLHRKTEINMLKAAIFRISFVELCSRTGCNITITCGVNNH